MNRKINAKKVYKYLEDVMDDWKPRIKEEIGCSEFLKVDWDTFEVYKMEVIDSVDFLLKSKFHEIKKAILTEEFEKTQRDDHVLTFEHAEKRNE